MQTAVVMLLEYQSEFYDHSCIVHLVEKGTTILVMDASQLRSHGQSVICRTARPIPAKGGERTPDGCTLPPGRRDGATEQVHQTTEIKDTQTDRRERLLCGSVGDHCDAESAGAPPAIEEFLLRCGVERADQAVEG